MNFERDQQSQLNYDEWIWRLLQNIATAKKFQIPIICVGNIYIGGTGKTPLASEIYKIISSHGKNPGFVKKGYNYLYDEIQMLKKVGKTFTNKNRKKAIEALILSGRNVAMESGDPQK